MDEIKSLSYKYYVGAADVGGKGNSYTGSVTLNPQRHNALDDEFKYKISFKQGEEGKRTLLTQCYVGTQAIDVVDKEKIQSIEFEGSDEGVEQAKKWLEEALELVRNG